MPLLGGEGIRVSGAALALLLFPSAHCIAHFVMLSVEVALLAFPLLPHDCSHGANNDEHFLVPSQLALAGTLRGFRAAAPYSCLVGARHCAWFLVASERNGSSSDFDVSSEGPTVA